MKIQCKVCEHVCPGPLCNKCGPFAMQCGDAMCIECEEIAIEDGGDDWIYSLQAEADAKENLDNPERLH